jgi:hypothetical protein
LQSLDPERSAAVLLDDRWHRVTPLVFFDDPEVETYLADTAAALSGHARESVRVIKTAMPRIMSLQHPNSAAADIAGRPVAPHENRCVASLRSVFKVYGAENALETGANVHRAGRPSR